MTQKPLRFPLCWASFGLEREDTADEVAKTFPGAVGTCHNPPEGDTLPRDQTQCSLYTGRWKQSPSRQRPHRGTGVQTPRGISQDLPRLITLLCKNEPFVMNTPLQTLNTETVSYQQQAPSSKKDNTTLETRPALLPRACDTWRCPDTPARVSGMQVMGSC